MKPRDLARDNLYSAPINLWVEDDLSRIYLGALWSNDPDIKFLIGGNNTGVAAILKDAEHSGHGNVFGVVDRDYRRSRFKEWLIPNRTFKNFVLPRHEIENYLLDTSALNASLLNIRRRSVDEITQILNHEAKMRCWTMACCQVVSRIRDSFFDKFIDHPKTFSADTQAAALTYITENEWFRSLPRKYSRIAEIRVGRLLDRAHARACRSIIDGEWQLEFPGKEIFHAVGNQIFDRSRARPNYQPKSAEFHADLAKSIAAWQVANQSVPTDLSTLLAALKARIRKA